MNADRCSKVLRLRVVGQEDGDAIVEEERTVGAVITVAFYDGRQVGGGRRRTHFERSCKL